MSTFTRKYPETTVEDPYKRVRYATGLVLGVDEFEQEQAYFIERDRLLTRALHGYGVVHGLPITVDVEGNDRVLTVGRGLAIEPSGQHVCVDRPQCANLDDWLSAHTEELENALESRPPTELCVAIVLRYGACETDFVPIPGEPCRTEDETRAPSRLADDFHLALEPVSEAPPHLEEEGVRTLGRLLQALQVRAHDSYAQPDDVATLVALIPEVDAGAGVSELISAAGEDADEVPTVEEGTVVPIEASQTRAIYEAALRSWIESARPRILCGKAEGEDQTEEQLPTANCPDGACLPVPEKDDGLVLGTLCLQVKSGDDVLVTGDDEDALKEGLSTEDRPILVPTRIFQERFGGGGGEDSLRGEDAGGDLTGEYPDPDVARLQGEDLSMVRPSPEGESEGPQQGDVLTYDDGMWRPKAPDTGGSDVQPNPSNAEKGLTRIVAMSWFHGYTYPEHQELNLTFPEDGHEIPQQGGVERPALAVAFGSTELGRGDVERLHRDRPTVVRADRGQIMETDERDSVRAPSLDPQTFRVFVEREEVPAMSSRFRLHPVGVVPLRRVRIRSVNTVNGELRMITGASIGTVDGLARGVAFLLPKGLEEIAGMIRDNRLDVEIRGDLILDQEGKAVDAEFTRAQLPTGDRAADKESGEAGVQGGTFVSWLRIADHPIVNLNTASTDELEQLPNVGPSVAKEIVQDREESGSMITDPYQLVSVDNLNRDRIDDWSTRVHPPLPPQ